jgi:hypothetical protein
MAVFADGGLTEEEAKLLREAFGGTEEKPTTVTPGADVPRSLEQDFDWETTFRTDAARIVRGWADILGWSADSLDSYVRDNMDGAFQYINKMVRVSPGSQQDPAELGHSRPYSRTSIGFKDVQNVTPDLFEQAWNAGISYFALQLGLTPDDFPKKSSGSGRSGGGGGAAGPTAEDIRNMFDEDQLTQQATDMWRAGLVAEPTHARDIAQAYINAVVDSRGEKKIDFQTFVEKRIKADPRHDLLYGHKPEGMTDLQYIQPFVQSAMAVMGGGSGDTSAVSDVVAGGAALGASSDAFRGRLARTDENKNTAGFTNDLEARMRAVSGVLRG